MFELNWDGIKKKVNAAMQAKIEAALTADELSQVTFGINENGDLRWSAPAEMQDKIMAALELDK